MYFNRLSTHKRKLQSLNETLSQTVYLLPDIIDDDDDDDDNFHN